MNNPILRFDFLTSTNKEPIFFSQPEKIYTTNDYNEVFVLLKEIQTAVNAGYYAAGYVSYEVANLLYDIQQEKKAQMPLLWFGIYKHPTSPPVERNGDFEISDWEIEETKESYATNVQKIIERIKHGETKQVNYTTSFRATFNGDSLSYYYQLKRAQQSNFSAYLNLGDWHILSVSPELFFEKTHNKLTVRPMKGTIHRGKTYVEDNELRNWLANSNKNKFENDLITHLMKEELMQVASNISIEAQYEIEKYPTVYQMTSTITGDVRANLTPIDVLMTLFPCGSISGVPKKETLQMIAQMEKNPREIYTGAIGFITPQQDAIFNVAIRTVVIHEKEKLARYFSGGAITELSKPEEEYKEVFSKAKVLQIKHPPFQLLETIGLFDGTYFLLEKHLKRLQQSAAYFSYTINIENIKEKLTEVAKKYNRDSWRVRLLTDSLGKISIEVYPLTEMQNTKITLAKAPIDKENIFLYHKTTARSHFDSFTKQLKEDELDVLLWNENREITEFTIGNVVVELNGQQYTPPVSSGLLNGTFREHLLERGEIKEKVITIDDLKHATNIWFINSVRKWIKVHF